MDAQARKAGVRAGKYAVQLLIGDPVVDNALSWTLADVVLQFADADKADPADVYAPKPEIQVGRGFGWPRRYLVAGGWGF